MTPQKNDDLSTITHGLINELREELHAHNRELQEERIRIRLLENNRQKDKDDIVELQRLLRLKDDEKHAILLRLTRTEDALETQKKNHEEAMEAQRKSSDAANEKEKGKIAFNREKILERVKGLWVVIGIILGGVLTALGQLLIEWFKIPKPPVPPTP